MKKQQWTMLFKVFSQTQTQTQTLTLTPRLLNSSSFSSASSYIARRHHRLFCSATTPTTTNTTSLFAAEHVLKQKKEKKLPLLIVPYDHKVGGGDGDVDGFSVCDGNLGFISLFDDDDVDDDVKKKKEGVYNKLHLPEMVDRKICGSSEGWLITVHENGEIQLLNPISRVLVHLPPLTAFPEVLEKLPARKEKSGKFFYFVNEDISGFFKQNLDFPGVVVDSSSHHHPVFKAYDSHLYRERFFKKVVTTTTTTTTTTTDDHHATTLLLPTVVMAIYGVEARRLAFCRPSDKQKRWMGCLQGDEGFYDDVTFYKGNFYAVGSFGDVVVVKGLDGPSPPFVETIIEGENKLSYKSRLGESVEYTGGVVLLEREEDKHIYKNYLVESISSSTDGGGCGGDLFKVVRCVETKYKKNGRMYRPLGFDTIGFSVMKVDFNGGAAAAGLVEVTTLGEDCALFVGVNHSFSFSASKIPGCKGNCVYFTDDHLSQFYKYGGHDMGVFNLEDGSIEKFDCETTSSSSQIFMPPPVWYVPN